MPMERDRYPADWDEISLSVKEAAGWSCQECGRPCRPPGQRWIDFANELIQLGWKPAELEKPTQFVLTTAHLDQDPGNNDPENLRALCAPCHLRHDAPFREANRTAKMERRGQLSIF